MWQLNPTSAAVFVGLGSAGLLVVIGLIVYWIVTESKDPTATDLSDIKKTLGETKKEINKNRIIRRTSQHRRF